MFNKKTELPSQKNAGRLIGGVGPRNRRTALLDGNIGVYYLQKAPFLRFAFDDLNVQVVPVLAISLKDNVDNSSLLAGLASAQSPNTFFTHHLNLSVLRTDLSILSKMA